LSEIGIELGFILDALLADDLNKLIQQAGDNQMDAIRHRAMDDNWRPVNYQNADSLCKFESEMRQLGLEYINQYSYGGCMTYLTANTIQFTRSYLSFFGDLLKVYTVDRQHLITSAFSDILTAHVSFLQKAASTDKYRSEVTVIGHNARFICNALLPVIMKKYHETTGIALQDLEGLNTTLTQIQQNLLSSK
jgi:hypothetical protein